MQGKSKKAFSKNVAAEMDAGKPQSQSLAIAYAIKRKNAKKMAHGGMVNEKLDPMHEPSDVMGTPPQGDMSDAVMLARAVMDKHMAMGGMYPTENDPHYASGGMIEDGSDVMEATSQTGDDFLSDETDTELAKQGMLPDLEHEVDGTVADQEKRKARLSAIMNRIHLSHMGASGPAIG